MQELPKGYYAVSREESEFFTYKGISYRVSPGKNCFPTLHDAAAHAAAVPEKILSGLSYESFSTPVILFDAGEHDIDKFEFPRSLTLLGQGACVSPNLPASRRTAPPKRNPARRQNESVLKGSFWYGKLRVTQAVETVMIDGFTLDLVRFQQESNAGERAFFAFRNLIYAGACGGPFFLFTPIPAESPLYLEVEFRGIRVQNFSGLGYGNSFVSLNAHRALFEDICYDTTDKPFGFTDLVRGFPNCPHNARQCEITVRGCYFRALSGANGLSTACGKEDAVALSVSDSTFLNASREEDSPLTPCLANDRCSLTVSGCLFADTRAARKSVAHLFGSGRNVQFTDCRVKGFSLLTDFAPAPPERAPAQIRNAAHLTKTEDPHRVIAVGEADFAPLHALYAGRNVYYGDLHAHSDSGGTSDGETPLAGYTKEMDRLHIDFTAIVDHRQMRGFFLPEWDDERFLIGTEPGTVLSGLKAAYEGYNKIHYIMLFPHKYGLAMVLANFPEFRFRGDELTGSFRSPPFTAERFAELVRYVYSIGGLVVHPHPKELLSSTDPMDYYIGEHTFLETISVSAWSNLSQQNYALWVQILNAGKHVYTSGGADAHGQITNAAVSAFYTREKNASAFFRQMRSGDFTVGFAGIRMCLDGHPMGSELRYRRGQVLTLEVGDFFKPQYHPDHVYQLRVFTDQGLAYESIFSGSQTQRLALHVRPRRYYRADVFDLTGGYAAAISNPIWLDAGT